MSIYLDFAWQGPHVEYGSGYDLMARKLKDSALRGFKVETDESGCEFDTKSYKITDQASLEWAIKNQVKATIPLEGASVGAESSFLRSVNVNDTSMFGVINTVISYPPFKPTEKPQLSEEALRILNGPDGVVKFRRSYGEYYVYGSECRSTFTATIKFSTSSREAMNKFKMSMTISADDVAEATEKLETSLKETESHISTEIHIHFTGYSNKPGVTVANTREIHTTYKHFQEDHSPVPFKALLKHYSTLDSRIPPPGECDISNKSEDVTSGFTRLFQLQSRAVSSPMKKAAQLAGKISDAYTELCRHDFSKPDALAAWNKRLDQYAQEMDIWERRKDLIDHINKYKGCPFPTGETWIESGTREFWGNGITPDDKNPWHQSLLAMDGDPMHKQWKTDYELGRCLDYTIPFSNYQRMIVGFKISSHWQDGTNGQFRIKKGGQLCASEIEVEMETYRTRGANWTVEAWTVDRELYELLPGYQTEA